MQEQQNNEILIPLSKTKIALLTIGSLVFVGAGILVGYQSGMVVIALAAISFFGMCGIYGASKLFDTKPGLIIGEQGLQDNASAVSGGLIRWEDITEIEMLDLQNSKFVLLFVRNPDFYLQRVNRFKRLWMRMNHKLYGTPLTIPAHTLKCDFYDLVATLDGTWRKQSPH